MESGENERQKPIDCTIPVFVLEYSLENLLMKEVILKYSAGGAGAGRTYRYADSSGRCGAADGGYPTNGGLSDPYDRRQ